MTSLSVTEAIQQRMSVREFQSKSVSRQLIEEILELACQSASGSNLQPWRLYAITGDVQADLIRVVGERAMQNPLGEGGDIPIYPEKLGEPWRRRRSECGERMYEALGISRDDKMGRLGQVFKNFQFFGPYI